MTTREINRYDFEEILDYVGLDPEEVLRENYSGRGMFGASCFGIVLDNVREAFGLFATMAEVGCDEDVSATCGRLACDLADAARIDDMGRSIIVYFPGYTLSDPCTG